MAPLRGSREESPNDNDRFDDSDYSDSDDDTRSVYSDSDSDLSASGILNGRSTFCLGKDDGEMPVYEAWSIRRPLDVKGRDWTLRFLGKRVYTHASLHKAEVWSEEKCQRELAKVHIRAIEDYHEKHRRRCWASRVFRRKAKTYEQHLDERCRDLPLHIQEMIFSLLKKRSSSTSTRYRDRTWTVVVMRPRERYRFASADMQDAQRHRFRAWRNSYLLPEILDYYIVIRGASAAVAPEGQALLGGDISSNPWREVDRAEERRRWRDACTREMDSRAKRHHSPPSYRGSRSPSRTRTPSPPSYCRAPSPPSELDVESRARRYIRITRGSSPLPPAPRPPVPSALQRPSPCAPGGFARPTVSVEYPMPYTPQHFGILSPPSPPPPIPPLGPETDAITEAAPSSCIACLATPVCSHMPRPRVCNRFINWKDETPTHPGCFICMATGYVPFFNPSNINGAPPPPPPPPAPLRMMPPTPPSDDCWARPPSLVEGAFWDEQGGRTRVPLSPGPPPYRSEPEDDDAATEIDEGEQEGDSERTVVDVGSQSGAQGRDGV